MADTDTTQKEQEAAAASEEEVVDEDEFSFVEDPTFESDYKGECVYEVKVSVPVVNCQKQTEEMFDELKKDVELPGFRKGRAPIKLIENKYSKAVRGEVESKLVSAAFQKLLKDEDLNPIAMPDIDGLGEENERKDDEPLTFTLKFEVSPRVELGKYRGVAIERPVVKVVDSDVDEALDNMRERYSMFETLKKGKAADGDQVVMDFKGTVDGEEFVGGAADGYPYVLGTKRFFPEFEEVLLGSSAGDELSCDVTLPENNPNEALRGKKATFTIKVNEVKRRKMPKLNDDFAKQVGAESMDDLKEKVSTQLRENSASQSTQIAEHRAMTQVMEACTYELPKTMIESIAKRIFQDELTRLQSSHVPAEEIQKNEDEMRARADEAAVADIKRMVTLNEIGQAEDVQVTDEDFEKEVEAMAQSMGMESSVVSGYLEEPDRRSGTEGRIFRTKAMAVIMDSAKVTDKEVTEEEIEAESKEEAKDDE